MRTQIADQRVFSSLFDTIFIKSITAEAGSTFNVIKATTHLAAVGDYVVGTSGGGIDICYPIVGIVDANNLVLAHNWPFEVFKDGAGITMKIFRKLPKMGETGYFSYVSAADIAVATAVEVGAATAGKRYVVRKISGSNLHATVATRLDLLDATTVKWQEGLAANGGGFDVNFPEPLVMTVGTALSVQCGTNGTATRVAIQGALI